MKPENNIPTSKFTEPEVDQMISNFGIKPSEETREKLRAQLLGQKEVFLSNEKERGRSGPEM